MALYSAGVGLGTFVAMATSIFFRSAGVGRIQDEADRLAEERRRAADGNATMASVSDKAK
jgi:hypothetical protein